MKWYRKAADQGHATAQTNLGWMYATGQGVTRDDVEAVKWFRKAAEQGYAIAQSNLGFMYYNGQGMTRNYVEAYVWLARAAAQGHKIAQSGLDGIRKLITSKQIAEAQKRAAAWKPVPTQ